MDLDQANKKAVNCFQAFSDNYGFLKSLVVGMPVKNSGEPIPQYTYPAYDYLKQFDFSSQIVFGYSCGFSSLWWALNSKAVFTLEYDEKSHMFIGTHKLENLSTTHIFKEDQESYITAITHLDKPVDVLVIDGELRELCVEYIVERIEKKLNSPKLIVFNNTANYLNSLNLLRKLDDYQQIDFHGMGPASTSSWATTVFINQEIKSLGYKFLPTNFRA